MKYAITIPEPCHENWGNMTATAKGKFCDSCKKEVVDFSNVSMAMLSRKLDTGSKLCGRFRPDQLNRTIRSSKGNTIRHSGVLVASVALLSGISPVNAQAQDPEPTAIVMGKMAVKGDVAIRSNISNSVTVSGTVSDSQNPLAGANVVLQGSKIGTQTDFDGNFILTIPRDSLKLNAVLEVSYIGFQSNEIKINNNLRTINVVLTMEEEILGEIVVVRQPNLFNRIGKLFRKNERKICEGDRVAD